MCPRWWLLRLDFAWALRSPLPPWRRPVWVWWLHFLAGRQGVTRHVLEGHSGVSLCRVFQQILEMLRWFAGKQIRNVAAIGGNIMTGR